MSGGTDQADIKFWADRVAADERVVWTARMKPWKDKFGLLVVFVVLAFLLWFSSRSIFLGLTMEEACSGLTRKTSCQIVHFFAWPFFILCLGSILYLVGLQLLIAHGKIVLRYAITNTSIRTSMSGVWNKETVRPIPLTIPYIRFNSLMFSGTIGFGGLEKSDLLSGIAAVTKLRETTA